MGLGIEFAGLRLVRDPRSGDCPGFNALGAALGNDDGTATELLWSALHGMSLLERVGLRQQYNVDREITSRGVRPYKLM